MVLPQAREKLNEGAKKEVEKVRHGRPKEDEGAENDEVVCYSDYSDVTVSRTAAALVYHLWKAASRSMDRLASSSASGIRIAAR